MHHASIVALFGLHPYHLVMTTLRRWKALITLVLVAVSSGCASTSANEQTATSPSSTTIDSPSLTPSPSSPTNITPSSSETHSSFPSGSTSPGVLNPDQTEGRDLTISDFFSVDGNDVKEDLYDVATLEGQKGVGSEVSYDETAIELRLANRYKNLTFNVGQANSSRSSDSILQIKIYKNGTSDKFDEVKFNEARSFDIDVSNVNALKIIMECQSQDGTPCGYDESLIGVVYEMRLKA